MQVVILLWICERPPPPSAGLIPQLLLVGCALTLLDRNLSSPTGTDPACQYHCMGWDNPADVLSRRILAHHLLQMKLWWRRPEWLVEDHLLRGRVGVHLDPVEEKEAVTSLAVESWSTLRPFELWLGLVIFIVRLYLQVTE